MGENTEQKYSEQHCGEWLPQCDNPDFSKQVESLVGSDSFEGGGEGEAPSACDLSSGRLKQEDCSDFQASLGNSMSGCVKTTKQSWKKGYGGEGINELERCAVPSCPPPACTLPSSRLTPSQSNSMVSRGAFLRGNLGAGFKTRRVRRPHRPKLPQRTVPAPCSRRASGRMHQDAALAPAIVDRTQRPGGLGVPIRPALPRPTLSSPWTLSGSASTFAPNRRLTAPQSSGDWSTLRGGKIPPTCWGKFN